MRKSNKVVVIMVVVIMMFSTVVINGQNYGEFTDVSREHWAYEQIKMMANKGIINGYDDNTFRPMATVSRAEFSKMLVLTLGLEKVDASTPSFTDVAKGNWAYPYIEAAKPYLTGFRSSDGYSFKPDMMAVREDMAVAVVRGLKISIDGVDKSVLNAYKDESMVSGNLRDYVAAAINEGIMVGSDNQFDPLGSLSRAEAATLLARLIEDKVVLVEEEKVVFDEIDTTTPRDVDQTSVEMDSDSDDDDSESALSKVPDLEVEIKDGRVNLDWSKVKSDGFKYYKVVVSKGDATPVYPGDGYAMAFSNVDNDEWNFSSGNSYNGGDFGGIIKGGEAYYISITAVYDGENYYASNVKRVTVPGSYSQPVPAERTPQLSAELEDDGVKLKWTRVLSDNFKYYKVVLSKANSAPSYPNDGYLTYISDPSKTEFFVEEGQGYNGGDFGGKVSADTYYMTVTAVYKDGKYTSNMKVLTVAD